MRGRVLEVSTSVPLLGCLAFGLIDRGTNVIQVRPITTCPLSCIFCSTDAGPKSKIRQTEYIVPLEYLVEEFKKLVAFKGERDIEAHIDTVGDPITYPKIVDLVSSLSQVKGVEVVSMQTHGSILTEKLVDNLSEAGLTRINLSLDALEPRLAREIADTAWYDVEKTLELMQHIASDTKIDLLVAPVWVPSVNDDEMPKIIRCAKSLGAGKKFPALGIQKYLTHRHGRKVRGVKPLSWGKFYGQLRLWEEKFGVKLILTPGDFGIHRRVMLPVPYGRFKTVRVKTVGPGWLKGEKLAVTNEGDRSVTLVKAGKIPIGTRLKARILRSKHNILIAEPVQAL